MNFNITFHSPFRVSTGLAKPGLDESVDLADPLPASSIKGVMRAAARDLGINPDLLDATFGTARAASPWSWSAPAFVTAPVARRRARVKINPETGTAVEGALMFGEEAWCTSAVYTIDQSAHLTDENRELQSAALVLAARAVRSLGANRNRGLGWVSITCVEHAVTAEQARELLTQGVEPC